MKNQAVWKSWIEEVLPAEISKVLLRQNFQRAPIDLKFLWGIDNIISVIYPTAKHHRSTCRSSTTNYVIFSITLYRKWTKWSVAGRNFCDIGFFRCSSVFKCFKSGFRIFISWKVMKSLFVEITCLKCAC